MTTALIMQDKNADFAAIAAAAGVTLSNVADFDLLPQTGLRAVYELNEGSGSPAVDHFSAHNGTIAGAAWDATGLAFASAINNDILTDLPSTTNFEFTLLAKFTGTGRILGPGGYVNGTNNTGVQGQIDVAANSGYGRLDLYCYNNLSTFQWKFINGAQATPLVGVWRIVSLSLDATTGECGIITDISTSTGLPVPTPVAASGNMYIGGTTGASAAMRLALATVHTRRLTDAERNLNFSFFRSMAATKGITLGAA